METIKAFFIVISTTILTTFAIYATMDKDRCNMPTKEELTAIYKSGYWAGAAAEAHRANMIGVDTFDMDSAFVHDSLRFSKLINN
jgi:hypothetical protein